MIDHRSNQPEPSTSGGTAERYRALTESAFDLICEIDSEGNYVYLSPNFASVTGYESQQLIGESVFGRVHPDEQDRLVSEYTAALASLRVGRAAFRMRHSNGEWHWYESALRGVRQPDGDKRVVMVSRDITVQKRHENELEALISLAKAINNQTQMPDIAAELAVHLRPLLPFDEIFIAWRREEELRVFGQSVEGEATDTTLERPVTTDCPLWNALERQSVWLVNNWQGSNLPLLEGVRAFIAVPMTMEHEVLGVLQFSANRPFVFTEEHVRLASMVGEQVTVAARQSSLLTASRESQRKYRALVNQVNAIVWEADPDFKLSFISPRVEQWLGYALDQCLADPHFGQGFIHVDDRERTRRERQSAVEAGNDYQIEYRATTSDGRELWLRDLGSVEINENQAVRVRGLTVDITERKQAEDALLQSNTILRATQEASAEGICLLDTRGVVCSFNHRFLQMWGIEVDLAAQLRDKRELFGCVLSMLRDPDEFVEKINFLQNHPEASTRDEISLRNGAIFERYSAPARSPDGHSYGRVWSFSDITERKRYEQQLSHQAFHDPLTDLPNRTLFVDRVKHALERLNRGDLIIAVLFLDLDRFKVINDTMGHEKGDWLLTEVASRLRGSLRPGDTAGRFGGDEFTLLLEDLHGVEEAKLVTERIADSLQQPFFFEGREVLISASIGIALGLTPNDTAESLLRHSDIAMYRAKNKGKARYEVFDMAMSASAMERLQIEVELRQAVKQNQLHLDYQPLIDLVSGRAIGVEALVRWDHPQRGLISPADFIPIAEESGMIVPIGRWVLREACQRARGWHLEFPDEPPLRISVNLSAKQFHHTNLVEEVQQVLAETGLEPHLLELEITESAIMEDAEATIGHLQMLKELGVRLAVDDFGTGYSSLSYIERFPLDVLKIDRSFVAQIGKHAAALLAETAANGNGHLNGNGNGNGHANGNGNGTATTKKGGKAKAAANGNGHNGKNGDGMIIMQAVSTLGQGLGMKLTAEGIETPEQLEQLRELGCDVGQGFLFAHPLHGDEISDLIRKSMVEQN